MPDSSFFPQWGQQSFDDRDLDSLLDGNTSDVPPALRPVADSLHALRAAPCPRELQGEAAARALFRSRFQEIPDQEAPLHGGPVPGDQPQHTLVMPAAPRRRHRAGAVRRPRRGVFAGLVSAAAAAVIVGAAAYTGHLPGPVQQLAHDAIAAPSARHVPGNTTASVQARSASPMPSERTQPATGASPSGPAGSSADPRQRKELCDKFWSDLENPRPGSAPWQTPRYSQLITAAGGQRKVFAYCFPVWDPQYAPQYPTLPAYPPYFPRRWNPEKQGGDGQPGAGDNGNGNGNGNASGPGDRNGPDSNGNTPTPTSSGASPSASADSSPGSDGSGAQQNGN